MSSIQRLLVANNGEMACSAMHTAQTLGIETVAVYSDADRDAPQTKPAGQVIRIDTSAVAVSRLAGRMHWRPQQEVGEICSLA